MCTPTARRLGLEEESGHGCPHVKVREIQTSTPQLRLQEMRLRKTAGKVPLSRLLPGLLPSPGSKNLWLSQHCALIYLLTLCFPPSLSTLHPFQAPSLPLALSTHSSNEQMSDVPLSNLLKLAWQEIITFDDI